ncbi:MAG: hypothetical protein R2827_12065 [Bdellovibrionales bacterium]
MKIDLSSIEDGDITSLLPTFSSLNCLLDPSIDYYKLQKSINFLNFELLSLTEEQDQISLVSTLNNYFFNEKAFTTCVENSEIHLPL